jgi:transcriptional regulator of acetoin/glycerol metabolism
VGINKAYYPELGEDGTCGIGGIRKADQNRDKPYVARGWKRCISAGINPYYGKCFKVLQGDELDRLLTENDKLIRFAKPFMEDLYSFVKGSGFVVVLADKNARVLEVMGDQQILENSASQLNFVTGACWDEKYVGNTAINTALFEDKPVQICGIEHFCLAHRDWACSAAPIHVLGETVGVLNVSGYQNMVHPHTLGMVVAAAMAIETKIEAHIASKVYKLDVHFLCHL